MFYGCCRFFFFFSSRRRHTRWPRDWSSDVCSSDLVGRASLVLIPGGLLALLSTTIVGVTTPDIIAELGTGISSAQWITTIYLLTAGLGIAVSGWASARYGVKQIGRASCRDRVESWG